MKPSPVSDESYGLFALRYAFRNLWRHKRRTSLTMATVLFSVAIAIIASRYSTAIMQLWADGAADTGSAHAQIHATGYSQKSEGLQQDLTLSEDSEMEQKIRQDSAVATTVRRLELEGIIVVGEQSSYFLGKGVEAANEIKVSPQLFTQNDQGSFVSDSVDDGIVVGKGLAASLGIKIGDEVTLITQTVQGSVNGIDAKVVGIVDAAIPSFSQRVVYTPIKLLQKLVRMPGRYTELAIKLNPDIEVERWVNVKKPLLKRQGAELSGWWDIEPVIRNVGKIWDSVVLVIAALLFLSTALSVLNIIFMMVAERTTEIGMLMAIGARPHDIKVLFALEASLIGIIGGGAGALIGNFVVLMMNVFGVPFDSPFGAGQLVIHPQINLTMSALVLMGAIIICYLSSLAPARRAALVEPVLAFRGQI